MVSLQKQKLGVSWDVIGLRLGLSPSVVYRLIRGDYDPRLSDLARISYLLELPWSMLRPPREPGLEFSDEELGVAARVRRANPRPDPITLTPGREELIQ